MKAFEPSSDNLLIIPLDDSKPTPGKLIIPSDEKENKIKQGKVFKVGPGKHENGELIPMRAKEGDIVYYLSFSEIRINIDGDNFMLVHEGEVVGFGREE